MHHRVRVRWVLLLAVAHGLLYLVLIPPWQHYDEPTHFEHAWLIANRAWRPTELDIDPAMRRAVAESMVHHQFYRYHLLPEPDLSTQVPIWIGISELRHSPLYYALVGMPLRLMRGADITVQLYAVRAVSLILFVLTIVSAVGLCAELVPPGHVLRWGIPLVLCLLPPFVALMTAVNNDVGTVWMLSIFLWGAVRTLCRGWTWRRALWLVSAAVLSATMKSTGAVALLLLPCVLVLDLWRRHDWPRRWLAGLGTVTLGATLILLCDWDDAAYWYYPEPRPAQAQHSRLTSASAPHGAALLTLAAPAEPAPPAHLINPILPIDVHALRAHPVTVGGWIWADRPAQGAFLSLILIMPGAPEPVGLTQPLTVTTSPRFVAWHTTIPAETRRIFFVVAAPHLPGAPPAALQLYFDGAVLVEGTWPTASPPHFDGEDGQGGSWAGRRFVNRLRNPSAEQIWPRVDQRLDRWLVHYGQVEATLGLAGMLDYERTGTYLLSTVAPRLLSSTFTALGWGQVRLSAARWDLPVHMILLIALLGTLRWAAGRWRRRAGRGSALVLLVLCVALLWAATFARALPALTPWTYVPTARYTFPGILPLGVGLAGGWWALPPRRWRYTGLGTLLLILLLLSLDAVWTSWHFFYA